MPKTVPHFDGPADEFFNVGDNDRVLRTSDGFHVHIYKEKTGWAARVTDLESQKYRLSLEIYLNEAELKAKCIEVVGEMRKARKESKNPQRRLL